MNEYYVIDEDDIAAAEAARGCPRCKLHGALLPGCPYYCAKWAIDKPEEERSEREKQIVEEYEKAGSSRL